MFDGAPRLLSADELRQKFQQAGLDSSVVNFSNLELVISHVHWQGRKQQLLQNTKYEKQNNNYIDN